MSLKKINNPVKTYLRKIQRKLAQRGTTEHTFRSDLEKLIEEIGGSEIIAMNERQMQMYGQPDFVIMKAQSQKVIGHIECKDIGKDLDKEDRSDQMARYKQALPNLILTDYHRFRWYQNGEQKLTEVNIKNLDQENLMAFQTLMQQFLSAKPQQTKDPKTLAENLAGHTKILKESVMEMLKDEKSAQSALLKTYRAVLIKNLKEEDFANMYAQTVSYGIFAARCLKPTGKFTKQDALTTTKTPFLNEILFQAAGPNAHSGTAWIAESIADQLNHADMKEILQTFGKGNGHRDPVIYFYENFLEAYDPETRENRGVYYTPEPVVSYIIRSVDKLLKTEFNLKEGISDCSKIQTGGEQKEQHRVLILDPATGTGSFPSSAIEHIHKHIVAKTGEGAWEDYAKNELLPRLYGFEFMMAPYVICHLKTSIKLAETGVKTSFGANKGEGDRLNVYLTNTLENTAAEAAPMLFQETEIVKEAKMAGKIKNDKPVMVVIGNPPYSGESKNKGKWITELMKEDNAGPSYFKLNGQKLTDLGEKTKWINDDYIKFIRFAQWRVKETGEGIIGFITNNNWLDGPTLRGMRQSLLKSFDKIYILNLHGDAQKTKGVPEGTKDENVFPITKGVAISLFVKTGKKGKSDQVAEAKYAEIFGRKASTNHTGKLEYLSSKDVETTDWKILEPKNPNYLLTPLDDTFHEEYENGWKIPAIFQKQSAGMVTARDKLTIHHTKASLKQTVERFKSLEESQARDEFNLPKDVRDWTIQRAQKDLANHPNASKHVTEVLYRPFDKRFTYYTGKSRGFICMPRPAITNQMISNQNIGLITTRQVKAGELTQVLITNRPIEAGITRGGGISTLFPLYTISENEKGIFDLEGEKTSNISEGFQSEIKRSIGQEAKPEEMLYYIYAILHSPLYRKRYEPQLKHDFPSIPLPANRANFNSLAGTGKKLAQLHLMEAEINDQQVPQFPAKGTNVVEKPSYDSQAQTVRINRQQVFQPVSKKTWEFTIGGYQPAQKWLQERKGRKLVHKDIEHYRYICGAITETQELMKEADAEFLKIIKNNP